MKCMNCDDTGWVCENHADRPWDGVSSRTDACHCGGAGEPCQKCNYSPSKDCPPRMPPGFDEIESMAALGFLMHIAMDAGAFRSLETMLQRLPPWRFCARFQLRGQASAPWAAMGENLEQIMTKANNHLKSWWAVQGSNLWPLPCQGRDLRNNLLVSVISRHFGHVSFITCPHVSWATLGAPATRAQVLG